MLRTIEEWPFVIPFSSWEHEEVKEEPRFYLEVLPVVVVEKIAQFCFEKGGVFRFFKFCEVAMNPTARESMVKRMCLWDRIKASKKLHAWSIVGQEDWEKLSEYRADDNSLSFEGLEEDNVLYEAFKVSEKVEFSYEGGTVNIKGPLKMFIIPFPKGAHPDWVAKQFKFETNELCQILIPTFQNELHLSSRKTFSIEEPHWVILGFGQIKNQNRSLIFHHKVLPTNGLFRKSLEEKVFQTSQSLSLPSIIVCKLFEFEKNEEKILSPINNPDLACNLAFSLE